MEPYYTRLGDSLTPYWLKPRRGLRCASNGAWIRLGVTMTFGLIHGFAFAQDLIEMNLPTGRMAELLFGFNLGVEAGQLLLVVLMLGAAATLRLLRLSMPRLLVVDLVSTGIVGFGLFLLVSRNYS